MVSLQIVYQLTTSHRVCDVTLNGHQRNCSTVAGKLDGFLPNDIPDEVYKNNGVHVTCLYLPSYNFFILNRAKSLHQDPLHHYGAQVMLWCTS